MSQVSAAMVSFRGPEAPAWVISGIESGVIASVCLFNYNFSSLEELRALTGSLHAAAERGGQLAPLIGIDQEGGQLMAVGHGATELPGNMALGATGSTELARRAGNMLADELLALGCNLNFAPVVDLASHLESHVVGLRAFGDRADDVTRLGLAVIEGLQERGVLATAKHFPGHGNTGFDTHATAPAANLSRAELEVSLEPFRAAIRAGVAAVMSVHVSFPALDAGPATLSRVILTDLLRGELGFEGLVITDAMDMEAVRHVAPETAVQQAVKAGVDLVLFGHLPDQEQLVKAVAAVTGPETRARIQAARQKIADGRAGPGSIGTAAHRQLAQEIADRAITAVRGSPQLRLGPEDRLVLVTFPRGAATPADSTDSSTLQLADALRARHATTSELTAGADESTAGIAARITGNQPARVVIATEDAAADPRQPELVAALQKAGLDPIAVILRSPLDANVLKDARHVICTYGLRRPQTEAVARLLFGEIEARGTLPVSLPPPEAVGA